MKSGETVWLSSESYSSLNQRDSNACRLVNYAPNVSTAIERVIVGVIESFDRYFMVGMVLLFLLGDFMHKSPIIHFFCINSGRFTAKGQHRFKGNEIYASN